MNEPINIEPMTEDMINESIQKYHSQTENIIQQIEETNEIINNICLEKYSNISKLNIMNFIMDTHYNKNILPYKYNSMTDDIKLEYLTEIDNTFTLKDYENFKNKKENNIINIKEIEEKRENEEKEIINKNEIFIKKYKYILHEYPELTQEQIFYYFCHDNYKDIDKYKELNIDDFNKDECIKINDAYKYYNPEHNRTLKNIIEERNKIDEENS